MKNRQTVTKGNSITGASQKEERALGRARIKRTELTRRTGCAIKADTIKRDLHQRQAKSQKRMKSERALERFVLDLALDWDAFHDLLFETFEDVGCDHHHTSCQRILAIMGLEDEAIQACLSYFTLQGGGCDCEVYLNVDMTEPKPLVDFSCEDCASDYDEYYMVQNDIWKVYGAGKGMLCIGCLEKRIGRKLRRQDFIDLPINEINAETQSLRLQARLSPEPSKAAPSADDRREMSYPDCGWQNRQRAA